MAYQELDWNDQAGINTCLLYDNRVNLKWRTLPAPLFPNGLLLQEMLSKGRRLIKPYIYHFNWMNGSRKKEYYMKKLGVWCPSVKGK